MCVSATERFYERETVYMLTRSRRASGHHTKHTRPTIHSALVALMGCAFIHSTTLFTATLDATAFVHLHELFNFHPCSGCSVGFRRVWHSSQKHVSRGGCMHDVFLARPCCIILIHAFTIGVDTCSDFSPHPLLFSVEGEGAQATIRNMNTFAWDLI